MARILVAPRIVNGVRVSLVQRDDGSRFWVKVPFMGMEDQHKNPGHSWITEATDEELDAHRLV